MEQILQKFLDIFDVAVVQDKSKEQLSVENLTMEADALLIIRLCEELLQITRELKETWVLGTMKVRKDESVDIQIDDAFNKFNALTEKISHFERVN